jgi:hypothetical protein
MSEINYFRQCLSIFLTQFGNVATGILFTRTIVLVEPYRYVLYELCHHIPPRQGNKSRCGWKGWKIKFIQIYTEWEDEKCIHASQGRKIAPDSKEYSTLIFFFRT